ncbi:hypothetical protein [Hydrogenivirga sp.]
MKVIKPGMFKVIVGEKGVYVLDDEKAEELIRENWELYLREKYGKRSPRTNKEIVEHPVEIGEEFIRRFFAGKGLLTSFKPCAFFVEGIKPEESELKEFLRSFLRTQAPMEKG